MVEMEHTVDKIRVLLAEDHTIVRKGLRSLLDDEPDIEVVGEAEDGREAVQIAQDLLPDVVVMDISMPNLGGLEATRQIKKYISDIKVLILTVHANEEYILQVLRAGASGYLIKQAAPAELISAIHVAYQGESYLSPAISRAVIEDYVRRAEGTEDLDSYSKLTSREREIMQLLAEGRSNREIAELLHISVKTVETHKANLMDKLDIHTVADLVRYAIQKGAIDLDG